MGKRKWTDIKAIEAGIIEMRKAGKIRKEIADYFGLNQKQIENWVTRHNREQAQLAKGILPGRRGRPRKDGKPPQTSEAAELKRLRMENQLLRDFLRFTERGSGQE